MRKTIGYALAVGIMVVSVIGKPFEVKADNTGGWLSYAQEVELDTTYSNCLDEGDYTRTGFDGATIATYIYDVYKISIPEKGKVSTYIESECKGYGGVYSIYYLYSVENPDNYIISRKGVEELNYSSARNVYYGSVDFSIDKEGDYYIVLRGEPYWNDYKDYTIAFNFRPSVSSPYISSVFGKKGALKALWNKVSGVDGYQIAVSSSSDFSDNSTKVYKVAGNSKSKKKIKKLNRKSNYYVRMRSYKSVNITGETKTYYSDWSDSVSMWTK